MDKKLCKERNHLFDWKDVSDTPAHRTCDGKTFRGTCVWCGGVQHKYYSGLMNVTADMLPQGIQQAQRIRQQLSESHAKRAAANAHFKANVAT